MPAWEPLPTIHLQIVGVERQFYQSVLAGVGSGLEETLDVAYLAVRLLIFPPLVTSGDHVGIIVNARRHW